MTPKKNDETNSTERLLQDMLIVQLALAGVPQLSIRSIVGCSIERVNRIGKHLNRARTRKTSEP